MLMGIVSELLPQHRYKLHISITKFTHWMRKSKLITQENDRQWKHVNSTSLECVNYIFDKGQNNNILWHRWKI